MAGPVGSEQRDIRGSKCLLHIGLIESGALIDLAAKAPACSEVDEDRATLSLIPAYGCGGPRLPAATALGSGAVRGITLRHIGANLVRQFLSEDC